MASRTDDSDQSRSDTQISELVKAVNDSSAVVRNLVVSYVLLATYVLVSVAATTDEVLLRDSGIAIPLLSGVTVKASQFFLVTPWLLTFLHLNVLLNATITAKKAHALNTLLALPSKGGIGQPRLRVTGFLFVQWILERRDDIFLRYLLAATSWITFVIMPLAVLLLIQGVFLPYHSAWITWFQRLAIIVDSLAIAALWPRILTAMTSSLDWWRAAIFSPLEPSAYRLVPSGGYTLLAALLTATTLSILLLTTPGETFDISDTSKTKTLGFSRNLSLAETRGVAVALTPEQETLLLGNDLERRVAVLVHIKGLDLRGRDLRYANLEGALLPKADLRGARLDHANLRYAKLYDANLAQSSLERADLSGVSAAGSILSDASLRDADLAEADMSATVLDKTSFLGANLAGATLDGASGEGTIFIGANLSNAKLRSVKIKSGFLDAADLTEVDARASDFEGSMFRVAFLEGGDLAGVSFKGAWLSGASLREANLAGIETEDARFELTDLLGARRTNAAERDAQSIEEVSRKLLPQKIAGLDERVKKALARLRALSNPTGPELAWACHQSEAKSCYLDAEQASDYLPLLTEYILLVSCASAAQYYRPLTSAPILQSYTASGVASTLGVRFTDEKFPSRGVGTRRAIAIQLVKRECAMNDTARRFVERLQTE